MASSLFFIVVLCLTGGLCAGAKYDCSVGKCCETCPAGWSQVGSRCFMFHFAEKDWSDAEITCVSLGGNLASIRTADDYTTLREMANRVTGRDKATWIGGYDAIKEGVWTWSDGSTFEFTGWAKDEPNNKGSAEHCMEMNLKERDYVNDEGCNERRSFICAKDAEYDL
ncbi:hypothetical protein PAMP_011744 [Pampus punctatissimus]